jgi:hypothetical protein
MVTSGGALFAQLLGNGAEFDIRHWANARESYFKAWDVDDYFNVAIQLLEV